MAYIAVDKTGGMFPVKRTIEVSGSRLRVTDEAVDAPGREPIRSEAALSHGEVATLSVLAGRVAAAGDQIETAPAGVDGGTTVVRVQDGPVASRVEIRDGSRVGPEVWELLDALDRLTPSTG